MLGLRIQQPPRRLGVANEPPYSNEEQSDCWQRAHRCENFITTSASTEQVVRFQLSKLKRVKSKIHLFPPQEKRVWRLKS